MNGNCYLNETSILFALDQPLGSTNWLFVYHAGLVDYFSEFTGDLFGEFNDENSNNFH